ncbi:MAG: MBOAT family protein [Bacteroidetes bacterium]|nr:MBOAT family protein [Bacteroidota bacterium]
MSFFDWDKIAQQLVYNESDRLLFNSTFFLCFLFLFLVAYRLVIKTGTVRIITVCLFSIYFFYKACGHYVVFILIAAVVDFYLSNAIHASVHHARRKLLLVLSIILNLGLLCAFKFTVPFIAFYNNFLNGTLTVPDIGIPVGISFYTFENLSYTIDVYRKKFTPVKRFMDYLFFLSYFPKLMMGPIVRASDFIPQLRKEINLSQHDIAKGLFLICTGVFKKIVISDYILLNLVNYVFDDPLRHTGMECLFAVYGYALIIYCDFSGYSDMAIGIAKWLGFDININFLAPYQSSNITEFWRRWHISLSTWLKDYLYIPLGGNRLGKVRTYINLFITMLLGGVWHGAGINFIIWGALHGLALGVHKVWMERYPAAALSKPTGLLRGVYMLLTFHFVCFCWIFFHADNFSAATDMIFQIATNFYWSGWATFAGNYLPVLALMAFGFALHLLPLRYNDMLIDKLAPLHWLVKAAIAVILIFIIVQVRVADTVLPIYLQF